MTDLGITRAAAWGSSGGGPYALATAAILPDAVAAVRVFASIGPYGEPGLDFADRLGGDDMREENRKSGLTISPSASAMCCTQTTGDRSTTRAPGKTTALPTTRGASTWPTSRNATAPPLTPGSRPASERFGVLG